MTGLAGRFDKCKCVILSFPVKFTEAKTYFVAAFRLNPNTPAPKVRTGTITDFHEWKAEMRGYDAARLDLHLATPQQIQAQNTAICIPQGGGKIIRHAQYVRTTAHTG